MPKLNNGRPSKTKNLIRTKINFDINRFGVILADVGGDPDRWSLKDEWQSFSKMYFQTSYARERYIRAAYNFYKKEKCNVLVPSGQVPLEECSPDNNF